MIALLCLFLLVLSIGGYALALVATERLSRRSRKTVWLCFSPPVSIVKPLSGLDDELQENLESFYRLDYPEYEIIFSFARRDDAAFEVARQVADRHPSIPTVFVVDGREPGANAKVNRLSAGFACARFRYLLMADGNVRIHPSFLRRAAGLFADGSVGLVSHLFVARGAKTVGSRLESLYLNGVLRPGTAAIAEILGTPCVVGKSILVSRDALNTIGGIEVLRDHLAEDFLLGRLIQKAGFAVLLSANSIETSEVSRSFIGSWSRQRRWAILRKRLGGPAYAAEFLSNPLPWFLGAAATGRAREGLLLYGLRLALEVASLAFCGILRPTDVLLMPLRDVVLVALFFAGLLGRRTRWRGRRLHVGSETVLLPDPATSALRAEVAFERN